jgi:hypothetical protein
MSTDDPNPFEPWAYFKRLGSLMPGDAYLIVKLAFHPEWKSLFIKNRGAGGK